MRRHERKRKTIRDAARASRRDLRILLLIAGAVGGFFLIAQPGRGADQTGEAADPVTDERLKEFAPSEEISADRAIAFPVDI